MTNQIAIVTDSVACLPQELVKQYKIEVVPIQLIIEGKNYQDGVDVTSDEFYKLLPKVKHSPTSAGAVPGAFLKAFQKVSQQDSNILCVTTSKKLSGMFDSAREAKEILYETMPGIAVEVFDSDTAAAAQGLVVLAAARAAAKNMQLSEVKIEAQKVARQVNMMGILNTLKYISKSGRVPSAVALAGQLLHIKPIFTLKDGEVLSLGNSRSINGGINRMVSIMEQQSMKGSPLHVAIMHADTMERAIQIKGMISQRFSNISELFITEFTPVMGAYTGPGVLAIAFYSSI